MRKVRVGSKYVFKAVPFDKINPPFGELKDGDIVKVINKFGCPPANTMGMCYVELNGVFMGMICTNSLINIAEWKNYQKEMKK